MQYRDVTADPPAAWQAAATDVANLNYLHTGAESGKRYEFRVRGMATVGSEPLPGDWTETNVVPKAGELPPPGSVGDVRQETCNACASTELKASWAHAAHATHYDVEVRASNSSTWESKFNDTALTNTALTVDGMTYRVSATVTGLTANQTYYVRARGLNYTVDTDPVLREGAWTDDAPPVVVGSSGASGASGAAAATELPKAPDAVGSVSVTHHGGSLAATWTASAGATAYQVAYSGDNGTNWTTAADAHGSTSIAISNVDSDTTYVVSVRAYNAGGASNWTDSAPASPTEGGDDGDDDS